VVESNNWSTIINFNTHLNTDHKLIFNNILFRFLISKMFDTELVKGGIALSITLTNG